MRINSHLILAFDYVLILVVGAPMRDYKKCWSYDVCVVLDGNPLVAEQLT